MSWLTTRSALHPELHLYLNVALDGYGETHDRVRGVPGNWGRTLDCIRSLYPLKEKYGDRFRLNVNTVVCAENYDEVDRLADFMWENFRLDGHYFNVVRGETKAGEGIKHVPPEVLPGMYARVAALTKRYGERMFAADDAATRFVKSVAYVGAITTHYRTQHENFNGPQRVALPLHGGRDDGRHRLQRRRARLRAAREVREPPRLRLRLRKAVGGRRAPRRAGSR